MRRLLGILATTGFVAAVVSACTVQDDAQSVDDADLSVEGGVGTDCSEAFGKPCDVQQPALTCCAFHQGLFILYTCRSLTNDVNNCGSCGHVCTCPAGQTPSCFMSACVCAG